MNYHKKKRQVVTSDFKKGDLLLFQFNNDPLPDHIGLCTEVSGTTVTSIEGNTGSGNDANGGMVMERQRPISKVLCAIRWWDINSEGYTPEKNIVRDIQKLINAHYRSGLTTDGLYGAKTKSAIVYAVQHELNSVYETNLKEDGVWGPKTSAAFKTLSPGSVGNLTMLMQCLLCIKQETVGVDGIFGPNTKKAVIFRRLMVLPPLVR